MQKCLTKLALFDNVEFCNALLPYFETFFVVNLFFKGFHIQKNEFLNIRLIKARSNPEQVPI